MGVIGGIASMSVVIITCCAPILGYMIYRRGLRIPIAYVLASIIMAGSVIAGIYQPITLPSEIWMIIISIYVLIAAGVPVWMILQPRDFINVQILYGGIIAILLGLLIGGGQGQLTINAPSFNIADGVSNLGLLWPMLFITIACGAISGFHALVAGGTTSKQISNECDAKRIGYNGMLLESILAVGVILTLGCGLLFSDYKALVWPTVEMGTKSNPILAFSLAVGSLLNTAFSLPKALGAIFGILLVEGFVITTLDAAVRINRYLFEELWVVLFKNPPAIMRKFWFNAGLSTVLMWVLAYFNVFSALWPIFGTSNQLLAALSLLAVSVWLFKRKQRAWFTLIPSALMTITTITSLIILLKRYIATSSYTLIITDILLLVFSVGVVVMGVGALLKMRKQPQETASPA
jgi:carbon starvation protein